MSARHESCRESGRSRVGRDQFGAEKPRRSRSGDQPRRRAEADRGVVPQAGGAAPGSVARSSQVRFDKVKKTLSDATCCFSSGTRASRISGAWLRVDIDPKGAYSMSRTTDSRTPAQGRRPRGACEVSGALPLSRRRWPRHSTSRPSPPAAGVVLHAELMYERCRASRASRGRSSSAPRSRSPNGSSTSTPIPARSSPAATCSSTSPRAGAFSIPIRSPCSTTRH